MTTRIGRLVGIALILALTVGGVFLLTRGGSATTNPETGSAPTAAATLIVVSATPQVTVEATTEPASSPTSLPTTAATETVQQTPAAVPPTETTTPPIVTPPVVSLPAAIAASPRGARQAVEFILRPEAVPLAVGQRIVGPGATVQRMPLVRPNPPIGQVVRSARTWLVPVPPGSEQAALAHARSDPDVESARLVPWPPLVPDPI